MSDDRRSVSWTCPRCGGIEYEAIALLINGQTPTPGAANTECALHYRKENPRPAS